MSSSEQAPEPTMDEILASIRKIIADDDQQEGNAPEQPAPSAAEAPVPAGEAQDNLADDIANALNQTAGEAAPAAPPAADEDIFDLTNEVPAAAAATPEAVPQMTPDPVPAAPEQPVMTPPSELQDLPQAGNDLLSGSPMVETPLPDDSAGFGQTGAGTVSPEELMADIPAAPVEPEATPDAEFPETLEAQPEVPPAPEAGAPEAFEMPAPTPPEPPQPPVEPMPEAEQPDPIAASVGTEGFSLPEETVETGAGTSTSLASGGLDIAGIVEEALAESPTPETPAAEPQMPVDAEMPVEDTAAIEMPEPTVPETAPEPEAVAMELAATEEHVLQEPEPEAEDSPSPAEALGEAGGKSLEDSVREMLKPMLREWLDENMPRIVQKSMDEDGGKS